MKLHIILQDSHSQKCAHVVELTGSATAQNYINFLGTQTSAQIIGCSVITPENVSGAPVATATSDVDDKIFLNFKSKDGLDVRKYVIASPTAGYKAAWLYDTDKGLRVSKVKGDAFASELSTALGLTGSKELTFTGGFYKHTK